MCSDNVLNVVLQVSLYWSLFQDTEGGREEAVHGGGGEAAAAPQAAAPGLQVPAQEEAGRGRRPRPRQSRQGGAADSAPHTQRGGQGQDREGRAGRGCGRHGELPHQVLRPVQRGAGRGPPARLPGHLQHGHHLESPTSQAEHGGVVQRDRDVPAVLLSLLLLPPQLPPLPVPFPRPQPGQLLLGLQPVLPLPLLLTQAGVAGSLGPAVNSEP